MRVLFKNAGSIDIGHADGRITTIAGLPGEELEVADDHGRLLHKLGIADEIPSAPAAAPAEAAPARKRGRPRKGQA